MIAVCAGPAWADPIQIAGFTTGCFDGPCTDADLTAVAFSEEFGVEFTGLDVLDVWADSSGVVSSARLGTFSRGNVNVSTAFDPLPFTLGVTFLLPDGGVGRVTSLLQAMNFGGGGKLTVDFVNDWQTVSFPGGSFDFMVNDIDDLTKNGGQDLYGAFGSGTYDSTTGVETPPAPVPEPATLVMVGSGMLFAARRMRRRRQP